MGSRESWPSFGKLLFPQAVCTVCSTKATALHKWWPGNWSTCLRSWCAVCSLQGQKKYQDHSQRLPLALHDSEEQSRRVRITQAGVLLNIQILLPPKKMRTMEQGLNEVVHVSPRFFSKSKSVVRVGRGSPAAVSSSCFLHF